MGPGDMQFRCLLIVAVQEERLGGEKGEMEAESTTAGGEMLIDSILSAELRTDANSDSVQTVEDIDAMPVYSWNSVCSQLSHTVVDWALAVPHFTELSSDDQLMTLKAGIYPCRVFAAVNLLTIKFVSDILECIWDLLLAVSGRFKRFLLLRLLLHGLSSKFHVPWKTVVPIVHSQISTYSNNSPGIPTRGVRECLSDSHSLPFP